jgi:AraC-like DNA-binding protein
MVSLTATVSALQFLPVLAAFETLGLPLERILAAAQLERAALTLPGARVSLESEFKLWAAAVDASQEPALGLVVAQQLKPGATGSFEYMLRHSETLEQLLERAQRFSRLTDDLSQISWECREGVVHVTISRLGNHPVPPAGTECLFAVAIRTTRTLYPGTDPVAVHFTHTSKAPAALYRKHFGCPVHFGAEQNRILFHEVWLRQPAQNVDGQLGKVLEEHTAHLLSQRPTSLDFVAQAHQRLSVLLAEGQASPDALAHALHLSERTLRRRLSSEGTSYQQLLDELRREQALARVMLDQFSLEQLANTLGFSDMSTFHRAFKRWTGLSPGRYREQMRRK